MRTQGSSRAYMVVSEHCGERVMLLKDNYYLYTIGDAFRSVAKGLGIYTTEWFKATVTLKYSTPTDLDDAAFFSTMELSIRQTKHDSFELHYDDGDIEMGGEDLGFEDVVKILTDYPSFLPGGKVTLSIERVRGEQDEG